MGTVGQGKWWGGTSSPLVVVYGPYVSSGVVASLGYSIVGFFFAVWASPCHVRAVMVRGVSKRVNGQMGGENEP